MLLVAPPSPLPPEADGECVFHRLKEIDTHCGETYSAYKKALKKNWHQIDETRKEQAALENCWREFKQYNKVRGGALDG